MTGGVIDYLELEDYLFAAERIPTNRWDTPANVIVITAQEIEDNHYQDIAESLSHVNGVVVFFGNLHVFRRTVAHNVISVRLYQFL